MRRVVLTVEVGETRIPLEAECRVGVWTTLENVTPLPFVVRESWGRLERRVPRRLEQVRDSVLRGVWMRVRPHPGGELEIQCEVSEAFVAQVAEVRLFDGRPLKLAVPRRYGYRVRTRFPEGSGVVFEWRPGFRILHLPRDGATPARAPRTRFRNGGVVGTCVGAPAEVEAFVQLWDVQEPRVLDVEGLIRKDVFLVSERRGIGFRVNEAGQPEPFPGSERLFRFESGSAPRKRGDG